MNLRSGKYVATIQTRCAIVYPIKDVKQQQINLMSAQLNSMGDRLTKKMLNPILLTIMQIPELLSNYVRFRLIAKERVEDILKHEPFQKSIRKYIRTSATMYFEWLKKRSDYVDSPDEIMTRIQARTKSIRVELIEALYHPDRHDRFIEKYGEIWVVIHLPYY